MEILSNLEIAAIKERFEQASPGPWKAFIEGRDHFGGSSFVGTGNHDIYLAGATGEDYDFIAHARQDIPRLIAEIERLKSAHV